MERMVHKWQLQIIRSGSGFFRLPKKQETDVYHMETEPDQLFGKEEKTGYPGMV